MPHTALQTSPPNHRVNFAASDSGDVRKQDHDCPAAKTATYSASVEAIERALCATGYPSLRSVQVEFERGIAVLWGRVPTYHQKQLAQATVLRMAGVRGVANGIEVVCGR